MGREKEKKEKYRVSRQRKILKEKSIFNNRVTRMIKVFQFNKKCTKEYFLDRWWK